METAGQYYGIVESLCVANLSKNMLRDRSLSSALLEADSLEALRGKIDALTPSPSLLRNHGDLNLVAYAGRLDETADTNDACFPDQLDREDPENIISGDFIDGVRARIEVVEESRGRTAEVAGLTQDLYEAENCLASALRRLEEPYRLLNRHST